MMRRTKQKTHIKREIKDAAMVYVPARRKRNPRGRTQSIHLVAPVCGPIRFNVTRLLNRYGIANAWGKSGYVYPDGKLHAGMRHDGANAISQYGELRVQKNQASWAEYIILRRQHYQIRGPLIDIRNAINAARHGGEMPAAWVDKECSDYGKDKDNGR